MSRPLPTPAALLVAAFLPALSAAPAPDADNGGILLPPGFRALVFADNLVVDRAIQGRPNNLRFIAVAPNGDVYAKTKRGPLLALRDTDGDGRADVVKEFGEGGGSGLLLHDGWLYHSTDKDVFRYRLTPGELVPAGAPERIVMDLPNQRTHETKAFFIDDRGRLVVEIGVPSNAYGGENDRRLGAKGSDATEFLKTYGGFWRFDAAKRDQKQSDGERITTGHRHVVAVAFNPVSKSAFLAMHGRDNLNTVAPQFYSEADMAELPGEEFHQLREGQNLGWPYTYWDPIKKARMIAPEFGGDGRKAEDPARYQAPVFSFPGHWAPLQMTFYFGNQFPSRYRGGAFIAFHGSWNRAPLSQRGYNVCFVPFDDQGQPTGGYEIFAWNFPGKPEFSSPRDATYRPGGVAVGPDGSLYISDTQKGRIWRVIYVGDRKVADAAPSANAATAVEIPSGPSASALVARADREHPAGRGVYLQFCAACHMADGSGVPNLQPGLLDSAVVKGDPSLLARVILHGPAAVLPADRPKFANIMPPNAALLSDRQTADVVNYVRAAFAGSTDARLTPEQVKALRTP